MYTKVAYSKYISTLAIVAFLFAILLTGCAKDELIPPAGDGFFDKTIQSADLIDSSKDLDGDDTDGDITDDEDDEDDTDRSVNR